MAYRYQTIEAPQEADVMSKLLVGGLAFVATVCFGVATIEYVSPNSLFVAPVASPAVGIYGPQTNGIHVMEAHKKGTGAVKNGRDSRSQRLGVKVYGDQAVKAGGIIIRQVGNTWHSGPGTGEGKDYTIFAKREGVVKFGWSKGRKTIAVVDAPEPAPVGKRRQARRDTVWPPRKSAAGLALASSTGELDQAEEN